MPRISEAVINAPSSDLRADIDRLMEADLPKMAAVRLKELWQRESGAATAAFVVTRFEKLRKRLDLQTCRVAILRSFTVEPIISLFRASAFCHGIDAVVQIGDFNAYPQEILDPKSSLYTFAPDVVILAVTTADCAPDLWDTYSGQAVQDICHRVSDGFMQWIQTFRIHSPATLIVHNLEQLAVPNSGALDAQSANGQLNAIRRINDEIQRTANTYQGVYVLDYDGLVARHGRLQWRDEHTWLMARMPIAARHLIHLSAEWMRFLAPITGKTAKVLVVDLDNTLWGGVVGEDGMAGIKLGREYPGSAYRALQQVMLDLTRRGILLAVCSKNNIEDVMEVLRQHPDMLLRSEHFAAMRINWNDKTQGLQEIAAELNIGIDSLAFLDDNPVEREQVRVALPEVSVIDLPSDPQRYAAILRGCPSFERLTLSSEDQQRTSIYAEQTKRAHAEQSFQSKEDFFYFLQQKAEISPVTTATLPRVAQLTQKTNQFNLTTRRFTEQQLLEIANTPNQQVMTIRVRDRFGDHGLVGVAITRDEYDVCEIEAFLLSCRVIGRTVETAFLSHLANAAVKRGSMRLIGPFVPTKKNTPSNTFYAQHGFELREQNGEAELWALDLRARRINCPDWIKVIDANG